MIYDPATVEEELLSVQRNVSPTEARTSLYNLVVFAAPENRERADSAVGHLLGRRPARVLQIHPRNGSDTDIHVSARCLLDSNQQSVCIQEIVIDATGDGTEPGLWSPLLLRDIPVFVLWLDRVAYRADDLLLAWEQADEIIIDSQGEYSEALGELLSTLLQVHDSHGVVFSDLGWRRLRPLREAVAELFSTEWALGKLEAIKAVQLSGLSASAGLLLTHWLASRLQWRPESGAEQVRTGGTSSPDAQVFRFADAQNSGKIRVEIDSRSSPDLSEVVVRFITDGGDTLSLESDGKGCIHRERSDGTSETEAYPVPNTGAALLDELDSARVDTVYLDTVRSLAEGISAAEV